MNQVQSSPKDWHIFSNSENPKMCQSLERKIFGPEIAVLRVGFSADPLI